MKSKNFKLLQCFVLAIVFLFCSLPSLHAAETQVSISASDTLAAIGDRIRLNVIIKTTADIDNIKLKAEEFRFEIIQQGETKKRKQQDYTVLEKSIDLSFFKTGDFNIGPFKVEMLKGEQVVESKETNSIPVTIKSSLTDEDKDIKPLKDLIEIEGNPFYMLKYVLALVALIAIIVIIVLWLKKRKTKKEEVTKPLLSPLEELETRIKELAAKDLFRKGKMKLHFLELTQILKTFLHRNYNFNAEDLTTYETVYQLKRREKESALLNNMQFLFNTSDLVKFAKFVPDAGVLAEVDRKLADNIASYKERQATLEQAQKEKKEKETAPVESTEPQQAAQEEKQ